MKIRFDTPPVSAQQSNGIAVRYAAAKREVPRWRWYLMLVLIAAPVLYVAARLLPALWWETAPGFVVVPALVVKVAGSGTVQNLLPVGSVVGLGERLFSVQALPVPPVRPVPAAPGPAAASRLPAPPLRTAAPIVEDTVQPLLEQALALAGRTLALRRERLATIEALQRAAAATLAESDTARGAVVQAESDVLRARADLQAHQQAWAHRRQAEEAAATAAATSIPAPIPAAPPAVPDPKAMVVTSPFAGVVAATAVVEGEVVSAGSEILTLQGREPPYIDAFVAPANLRQAQPGRRATLHFPDATRLRAVVVAAMAQTARLPAERVGPLSPRSQAILVRLQPDHAESLPASLRIHGLPLDVRFDHVWPWSGPAGGAPADRGQ